jgi:hypothetical protein
MDLQEVGLGGIDSFDLAHEEVAGSCEYSNKPSGSIKCGKFLD